MGDNLSEGMGAMNLGDRPTTPVGQGTRAYNAAPNRPKKSNQGRGTGHGTRLTYGYELNKPGGRRRKRKSRRKSRRKRKTKRKKRRKSRKRRKTRRRRRKR